MKRTKKITKLLVETERIFVFRFVGALQHGWCVECGAETEMATVAEAARVGGLTELAICQLIETRALHFREDSEGRVLVCLNSLSNETRRKK